MASLYAMGFKTDEMYKIFKKYGKKIKYVDLKNIVKLIFGLIFTGKIQIDGLNSGKQIEKLMNKLAESKQIHEISDIQKILVIPSVDLCHGNVICFTSYTFRKPPSDKIVFVNDINIGKAVRASCSYPVVFSPCQYKNTKLIDGGIRENVPWKELKALGATKIINIMFEDDDEQICDKNLVEVAGRSISLLGRELSNYEMEGADIILKIKSKKVGLLDINKMDELYKQGYKQTKKQINKILQIN